MTIAFLFGMLAGGLAAAILGYLAGAIRYRRERRRQLARLRPPYIWDR